jgi:glucokinase
MSNQNPQSTNAADCIGVQISGNSLFAMLVAANDGRVVERREAALDAGQMTEQIANLISELREVSPSVSAIGIGLPGLVDPDSGRIMVSSDFPSLVGNNIQAEIVRRVGLTVTLENDANAAAYAEYKIGAGRGSRSMFYSLIGNGIGGALILDGRLWLGASGFAGEFGYIAIGAEGDVLESVASAPNIVRRTHERLFRDGTSSLSKLSLNRNFTAADIAREARNGDDFALLMIERTGRYIGTAIASVINLLNIERIVLGGGVMEAGDLILEPIIREAGRRSFQPCFEAAQIVAAQLGTDAIAIGAAMLARDAAQQASATA